jgi:hypothetical protein
MIHKIVLPLKMLLDRPFIESFEWVCAKIHLNAGTTYLFFENIYLFVLFIYLLILLYYIIISYQKILYNNLSQAI